MEYYSVKTIIYNNGKIEVFMDDTKVVEEKPDSRHVVQIGSDLYIDWFEDIESAKLYIKKVEETRWGF